MKKTEMFGKSMCVIVGVVFMLVGINEKNKYSEFRKNAVEHSATITEIEKRNDNSKVYVKYTVSGQEYKNTLGYYTSGMYVGKEITIYYNPENPNDIQASGFGAYIIFGFGAVCFLAGAGWIFAGIKRKNLKQMLISMDYVVHAEFESVDHDTSLKVNGKSPYKILCRWVDKGDSITYLYKSENIWYNPSKTIKDKGITTFPVYINPNNPKQYYISIEQIEEKVVDLT